MQIHDFEHFQKQTKNANTTHTHICAQIIAGSNFDIIFPVEPQLNNLNTRDSRVSAMLPPPPHSREKIEIAKLIKSGQEPNEIYL